MACLFRYPRKSAVNWALTDFFFKLGFEELDEIFFLFFFFLVWESHRYILAHIRFFSYGFTLPVLWGREESAVIASLSISSLFSIIYIIDLGFPNITFSKEKSHRDPGNVLPEYLNYFYWFVWAQKLADNFSFLSCRN